MLSSNNEMDRSMDEWNVSCLSEMSTIEQWKDEHCCQTMIDGRRMDVGSLLVLLYYRHHRTRMDEWMDVVVNREGWRDVVVVVEK